MNSTDPGKHTTGSLRLIIIIIKTIIALGHGHRSSLSSIISSSRAVHVIDACRLATSHYLPSLAHHVKVLIMHPCGALLFEGPLALRMLHDKKEAVR